MIRTAGKKDMYLIENEEKEGVLCCVSAYEIRNYI